MICSVRNGQGGWDYYQTRSSPAVGRGVGQVALDDALPALPPDAHLVGQGQAVRGSVCGGGAGLGNVPVEGVVVGTWVTLGIIGLILWRLYG